MQWYKRSTSSMLYTLLYTSICQICMWIFVAPSVASIFRSPHRGFRHYQQLQGGRYQLLNMSLARKLSTLWQQTSVDIVDLSFLRRTKKVARMVMRSMQTTSGRFGVDPQSFALETVQIAIKSVLSSFLLFDLLSFFTSTMDAFTLCLIKPLAFKIEGSYAVFQNLCLPSDAAVKYWLLFTLFCAYLLQPCHEQICNTKGKESWCEKNEKNYLEDSDWLTSW